MEDYQLKIEALMQTKDANNSLLAVLLSRACLGWSTAKALQYLVPAYRLQKSGQASNFIATYAVSNLQIVYHLSTAYVPYMEADISVSRYVQVHQDHEHQLIDSLSGFIDIQAGNLAGYKSAIEADFKSITPFIEEYLVL